MDNKDDGKNALTAATLCLAVITIVGVLFASTCEAEEREFWVFGDSLTATPDSWAEQINDYDFAHMHNVAQRGLRMVDLVIPDWMSCKDSEVIIRLGTNDSGNNVPNADYEEALRRNLSLLVAKDCKVWLTLPSIIDQYDEAHHARSIEKRELTELVAREYQSVTVLDAPYDPDQTTDTLHPNAGQQFWVAAWYVVALGL